MLAVMGAVWCVYELCGMCDVTVVRVHEYSGVESERLGGRI